MIASPQNDEPTREQILANPDTRNAWINFQMGLHGTSFADIARELGVSRSAVRSALDKPYPKMERAIAEKIGMAPEAIWPERYQKNVVSTRAKGLRRRWRK